MAYPAMNLLCSTEYDILEARSSLEQHQLRRAGRSVKRAEKALASLEDDVVELRRNIAMLNRLLNEKTLTEAELEQSFDACETQPAQLNLVK